MERIHGSQLPVAPQKAESKPRKSKKRDDDMEWDKVNAEEDVLSEETLGKLTEEEKERLRAVLSK